MSLAVARGHCGYSCKALNLLSFQTFGVPKLCLREGIMPGISTGTVVRWKLVAQDTKDEFVKHESDKEVSAYVREDGDDADVSAILGKYIVDAVEKEGEN